MSIRFLVSLVVASCVAAGTVSAQSQSNNEHGSREVLGVIVPRFALDHAGRRYFDTLIREPCDTKAVRQLGYAVGKAGYRRQAADLFVRFSERCGDHAPSLRAATNHLLTISDYPKAIKIADRLIAMEPFHDNGYFLRGLAHFRSHQSEKAIDDFVTAIELFENKTKIASSGYVYLSKSYARLGQYCDAIAPIKSWIAIDPDRHETSRTRAMIEALRDRGSCKSEAKKLERSRLRRRGRTISLKVSINGVRGRFILDTGATFVAMKRSFAEKAKVKIDEASSIRLSTANGLVKAKRGRAKTIKLRSLKAKNVPIVVQTDNRGSYGRRIDGLLGMSFLSRFNLAISRKYVTLSSR